MGGFNYGGKGDGTGWSSERGTGSEPGAALTAMGVAVTEATTMGMEVIRLIGS